ncbi:hypothetical protein NDU88_003391 [Pleurodeles waltl]|uniref:Uncharacterized protein n=1 Tax=Pleurodeles waltl TaxID=8319 RepID=A0AAV7V0J3_PLEWA|nr:hypothetical protein NDU88_003391 [Pleurodeles waltl]
MLTINAPYSWGPQAFHSSEFKTEGRERARQRQCEQPNTPHGEQYAFELSSPDQSYSQWRLLRGSWAAG